MIGTGDNFYTPDGIKGVDDPAWHTHWANIYQTKENLKDLLWYGSLGNHDYNTKHQYAYFFYKAHGWRLDDHVWSHSHKLASGDEVAFVHADTVYLNYGRKG